MTREIEHIVPVPTNESTNWRLRTVVSVGLSVVALVLAGVIVATRDWKRPEPDPHDPGRAANQWYEKRAYELFLGRLNCQRDDDQDGYGLCTVTWHGLQRIVLLQCATPWGQKNRNAAGCQEVRPEAAQPAGAARSQP